jgi:hypothetical protein
MQWSTPLRLAAALALAGCDGKTLVIESDTEWAGTINYIGGVGGTGNASIDLDAVPTDVCWTVQKLTEFGFLRAYLADENWFGLSEETDGDQTTTDPQGEVSGCNE